jgi:hypothetical protein
MKVRSLNPLPSSPSDAVRDHVRQAYLQPARDRGVSTFTVNVGQVHRELSLKNRIPLVCQALKSDKFLTSNGLRLIFESGPPSGQSTTVTYTYEFAEATKDPRSTPDPWNELRGSLKGIYASLGGGEAYLKKEREALESRKETR